jgi:hypothetical protein
MRRIRIKNPTINYTYQTFIDALYTAGVSLTVKNNNSFAANDLIVVGNPGDEVTELKKLNGISGNTVLTLASALNFAHAKDTMVYKVLWDFVSIEGRSSSAGVFAEITQSPVQWDSKSKETIYYHSSGTDDWEYRFRFYNSVSLLYSEYSPTLTGAGFTKYQMGYIIREARKIAGDVDGRVMSTDELLRGATRAKNIIRAKNAKFWFWKVNGYQDSKTVAATAGNSVYSLAGITDLGVLDFIEYRYANGATDQKYPLEQKSDIEFLEYTKNLNRAQNDYPELFRLLPPNSSSAKGYFETEFKIQNSNVGTFYINYYKEETDYNSVDDTTAILIPEILEDYLIHLIYQAKGNSEKGAEYLKKFYGPDNRKKTMDAAELEGISLLTELDKQYKTVQGQPKSLWRFRGQKAMSRLYGSRRSVSPDYARENYFKGE